MPPPTWSILPYNAADGPTGGGVDLAEVQNTLQQAKDVLADMQGVVRANDYKIDDTVENLRTATDNLGQLTDELKQRPWSLIRIKQPKDRKVPE